MNLKKTTTIQKIKHFYVKEKKILKKNIKFVQFS